MTYFSTLSKEQLKELQLKSRDSLNYNNKKRNYVAYIWYSNGIPIEEIAKNLGVKKRQAYNLIANGKKLPLMIK